MKKFKNLAQVRLHLRYYLKFVSTYQSDFDISMVNLTDAFENMGKNSFYIAFRETGVTDSIEFNGKAWNEFKNSFIIAVSVKYEDEQYIVKPMTRYEIDKVGKECL